MLSGNDVIQYQLILLVVRATSQAMHVGSDLLRCIVMQMNQTLYCFAV